MSAVRKSDPGKTLAITGAVLLFGPLIGLLGTVAGMMGAFQTLGDKGIAHPKMLAASVQITLLATAGGMVLGLIGVILLIISLFNCRYRATWFFWYLVIYGGLIMFGFPIGTIIGVALLGFCLTHKDEFLSRKQVAGCV